MSISQPSAGRPGVRAWNTTPDCFFVSYQRDPRTGFIKIFENMAKLDMMNQFATHVGGGLFACPAGVKQGGFVGQELFA